MPHRQYFGIALVVGLALVAAGWHGFAAEEKGEQGPRTGTAKARRDAAKKVYEGSWQHHVQQPESRSADVGYFHDWSVRWLQAERDLSRKKADQITALEGHLKRMQFWKQLLDDTVKEGQAPQYEASAGAFFLLEAEDWLAEAKAEGK